MLNRKEIMKRAWTLYRNIRRDFHPDRTFADCLKDAWAEAKRTLARAKETKRFYDEVCTEVIANGESAVREARRAWDKEARISLEKSFEESEEKGYAEQEMYMARMTAWEVAIANFKPYRKPTISNEIVNSAILATM